MTGSAMTTAKAYDRAADEWYVEPASCTTALLRVERFSGLTLDPACGKGNIVTALRAAGVTALGTDIVQRVDDAPWFGGVLDFLTTTPGVLPANIVCNPPFYRAKGAEAFIRRALALASHKVAIFADLKFLAGSKRANGLFSEFPPDRVWVITPRPSCPPGQHLLDGGKAEGGKADWCWLVWDLMQPERMRGQTRMSWLRSDERAAQ